MQIYLVENLFRCDHMLTLVNKQDDNLFVVSHECESAWKFIHNIMPEAKIMLLPRVPMSGLGKEDSFISQLAFVRYGKLLTHRMKLEGDVCYLFNACDSLHFFMLLVGMEMEKRYVEICKDFDIPQVTDLTPKYEEHVRHLSQIIGLEIGVFKAPSWLSLGLVERPEALDVTPLSWPELAEKFPIFDEKPPENAVLFVDAPLQSFRSVGIRLNLEASRKRVVDYCEKLLDSGKEIHIKPHPNEDQTTFQGTRIEDRITHLPGAFPAELVMADYKEIYGFNSSSLGEAKTKSLGGLITFLGDESEERFYNTLKSVNAEYEVVNGF